MRKNKNNTLYVWGSIFNKDRCQFDHASDDDDDDDTLVNGYFNF